jgi:TetR/AcrR family transcriptional repressor of nem operon
MGRTSDSKERLMAAAVVLIWEGSYGGVTIDDICTKAGVQKGSCYHFFKSKADLASAALESAWQDEIKPKMDALFSASKTPLERLNAFLESIYHGQVKIKADHGKVLGCPICTVGSEMSTQEAEVNAKVREIITHKRRYITSALRDAVADGSIDPCDPVQMTIALTGMIDGVVAEARIMNDPETLRVLPAMGLALLSAKKPIKTPVLA